MSGGAGRKTRTGDRQIRGVQGDHLNTYNLPTGTESWSAEPTWTVPFTTAGDEETIGSWLVSSWVRGGQSDLPHPLALNTITMPLFSLT